MSSNTTTTNNYNNGNGGGRGYSQGYNQGGRGGGRQGGGRGGGRGGRGGRGQGRNNNNYNYNNKSSVNTAKVGLIKEGILKNVVISVSGNRPTQYKAMHKALQSYSADKGYTGVADIINKMKDWDDSLPPPNNFYPLEPDATQRATWSRTVQVNAGPDANNNPIMVDKEIITNQYLMNLALGKYDRERKEKEKKWNNCQRDKKSVITVIRGQLDDDTLAELELSTGYELASENADIVTILNNLKAICFGGDDGGISFKPMSCMIAIKSLHNFVNHNPKDVYQFKDDVKTKFGATKAVSGKFPNGTMCMEYLLKAQTTPQTFDDWRLMNDVDRAKWEKKGDALNQAMLVLMNSKNESAKTTLSTMHSTLETGTCYPLDPERMTRLLTSKFAMKNPPSYSQNNNNNNNNRTKSNKDKDKDKDESGDQNETSGGHIESASQNNTDGATSTNGTAAAHIVVHDGIAAELLLAHPADDDYWGDYVDSDDIDGYSVDTENSAEIMTGVLGAHIISTVVDEEEFTDDVLEIPQVPHHVLSTMDSIEEQVDNDQARKWLTFWDFQSGGRRN